MIRGSWTVVHPRLECGRIGVGHRASGLSTPPFPDPHAAIGISPTLPFHNSAFIIHNSPQAMRLREVWVRLAQHAPPDPALPLPSSLVHTSSFMILPARNAHPARDAPTSVTCLAIGLRRKKPPGCRHPGVRYRATRFASPVRGSRPAACHSRAIVTDPMPERGTNQPTAGRPSSARDIPCCRLSKGRSSPAEARSADYTTCLP